MWSKLLFTLLISLPLSLQAQIKCYRFSMYLPTAKWQDTSCVACTSDPKVIAQVNSELSKPFFERDKIISGNIAGGSAGVNRNGSHEFLWHFVPEQWDLVDIAAEVCDGRPYSDIDMDTAYFFNRVGRYCPWTSAVAEEISATNIKDATGRDVGIALFPNPAANYISIASKKAIQGKLCFYTVTGQQVLEKSLSIPDNGIVTVSTEHLVNGLYILTLVDGSNRPKQYISIVK